MFTESNLNTSKLLIVEDEDDKRDGIIRILNYDGDWPLSNIIDLKCSEEAKKVIEELDPDLVLLDLKIPRNDDEEPDIANAIDVLKEIELHNYKQNRDVKVIIISGSVEDAGVQRLITGDRSNIVTFMDKNEAAIDPDKFKDKLLGYIKRALTTIPRQKSVTYSSIRRSEVHKLKDVKPELWKKIDEQLLDEFEKLYEKKANVHPRAKQIIITCGELVEDIISYLKSDSYKLSKNDYGDDYISVRNRLNALTGRKFISPDEGFEFNQEDALISRAASEYAILAYRFRNQASHSQKDDNKNDKIFKDKIFTKEDAAISINLIIPLIIEYINYLKNK